MADPGDDGRRSFVDLHNDVTAADIALAARERHDRNRARQALDDARYGHRPGKTGNIPGLALLSGALGRAIADTGTTTFRPPYVPVSFGLARA